MAKDTDLCVSPLHVNKEDRKLLVIPRTPPAHEMAVALGGQFSTIRRVSFCHSYNLRCAPQSLGALTAQRVGRQELFALNGVA
jgi:hypothetical protein